MPYAQELEFGLEAVRSATRLVRDIQQEMVTPALTKDDRSPVTVGDFASQALIAQGLETAFPDDDLVGEEQGGMLVDNQPALDRIVYFVRRRAPGATAEAVCRWIDRGASRPGNRYWTVDPIDGTKGFLRGEQYAVALALVVDGQVRLGVLGCPHLAQGGEQQVGGPGSLLWAVEGEGAWVRPLEGESEERRPLHVSTRNDPAQARLLRSVESGHTNEAQIEQVARQMGVDAAPVRLDSLAKQAVLASGKGDVLLRLISPDRPDYKEKIWDQAAGKVLVEEAGGRVTDLDGRPLDFSTGRKLQNNRGVLATNGLLHEPALAALRAVSA